MKTPAYGEVWVGARDSRGLFAKIAGVLTLKDLDIGGAQAYTRDDGVALDGFFVTSGDREIPEDAELWSGLAEDLCRALEGELDIEAELRQHRQRYRPGEPTTAGPPQGTTASNRVSRRYTVVEVTARDRTGLLHDLALAFTRRDLSIHHAVIATRGSVVLDTFYVALPDGSRPEEGDLAPLLADLEALVLAEDPA